MVAPFMFEVEHQGGQIVVQISLKRTDVHLIHPASPAIALDSAEGAEHPSQIDSSGQGMNFTALVGQETLLAERRCCEAAQAEPAEHSHFGGVFSEQQDCPKQARRTRNGVSLLGSIPDRKEYRLLLETSHASRQTGTALRCPGKAATTMAVLTTPN